MFRTFFQLVAGAACAALLSLSFVPYSHATDQTTDYLMWRLPSTKISFPVYVYQDSVQVDYLYGTTQQAFIGTYDPNSTDATFDLYYQNTDSTWSGCKLVLTKGQVGTATTCPGTVINNPVQNSNVYTLAMGAIPWQKANATPSNPTPVNYGKRKITFENDTDYASIRIGQVCTKSKNLKNPACTNNSNLFEIAKGETAILYAYGDGTSPPTEQLPGLISTAFTLTAYQNTKGEWVETGGYGIGQTPYATKIEFTFLPVNITNNVQTPTGATNFDISAVDGYNISVTAFPEDTTYCTYTVPPENSNVLGAGKYDSENVLAQIQGTEEICNNSSELPAGYTKTDPSKWNLTLKTTGGDYQGCLSPCTYAHINSEPKKYRDMFCCAGSYGTSSTCDQPSGQLGANNSTYVTNLNDKTKHVYTFAYDDAIKDFACPAQTDLRIVFGHAEAM